MHTVAEIFQAISENMEKVVKGKSPIIHQVLTCFFSEGHLLIQDSPGLGKTLISKALTRSINAEFSRVQFTSDLLPSDLLGVPIWKPSESEFEFHPGPIFSNLLLADEINRSSPKTQSALLEAMEESQVTIDKKTYPLPKPFMVIATQNPHETHGTYPLLESQLDRFMVVLDVGYPDPHSEEEMLDIHQTGNKLEDLKPVVDIDVITTAMKSIVEIHVSQPMRKYLVDIATATRNHPSITTGMSPRATLNLQHISQTVASINGRDFVTPEDVKSVLKNTIAHRIYPTDNNPQTAIATLNEIIETLPIPLLAEVGKPSKR